MQPQVRKANTHIEGTMLPFFEQEKSLGRVQLNQHITELGTGTLFIDQLEGEEHLGLRYEAIKQQDNKVS